MSFKINPMSLADFYKVSHPFQYPAKTEYVHSNFTPRKSRMPGVDRMVFFGFQAFCKAYLEDYFNENFFKLSKAEAVASFERRMQTSLGGLASYAHIEALHDLGFLPVCIKAVPEGTPVPMRCAALTIVNTDARFAWVTNFLETLMSDSIWQACTSATIAHEYRKLLDRHARLTGMPLEFVPWQGHDFSMRGMSSLESAYLSGMGHLLSFTGTDTIPAIDALEYFYEADAEKELIGGSVPASEHSVMCCGGTDGEEETYRRLITKVYPAGIVSIVSDTWDLWSVCTRTLTALRAEILARDGKVVIRPDSGDPADILCGDAASSDARARKGVVELLWDVFGGSVTQRGYRLLDNHIGAIYGDSITLERADDICRRLAGKGFASQVVFGIGSYTYQYNTRDTFGTAIKATWVQIDGVKKAIFKAPKTDDGTKNSAMGLLHVDLKPGTNELIMTDNVSEEQESKGLLQPVWENGHFVRRQTLAQIRAVLARHRAEDVWLD